MPSLITINGLNETLSQLTCKAGTQKAAFLSALKSHFPDQESLNNKQSITVEQLIKEIWNETEPSAIKKRRKSISSLKSALNRELKKLSRENKNQEGIIVNRNNIFSISDERKTSLLQKLSGSMADSRGIDEALNSLKQLIPKLQDDGIHLELNKLLDSLKEAQQTINHLSEELSEKNQRIGNLEGQLSSRTADKADSHREDGNEDDLEEIEALEDELEIVEDEQELNEGTEPEEEIEALEDELEIVEDEQELNEGTEPEEEIEALEDELEIVEDEQELNEGTEPEEEIEALEDDLEIVDGDNISEQKSQTDDNSESPKKLLEVLSKYMEPEEAENQETLTESGEGLVAQLLARFTPRFTKIAAGIYSLGTAAPKHDEHSLEQRHISAFYMGQYPVTNDIFELFVRETGYKTEAEIAGYSQVYRARCVAAINPATGRQSISISRGGGGSQIEGADWRHPEGQGSSIVSRGNHPVVQVSRRDAMAFAAWAGKRLPSEAEWEAAARGLNSQQPFPWGHNWSPEQANTASSYIGGTTAVDAHPGNVSPTGIHDLLGNVYEWTSPVEPVNGKIKYILKGGCWNSNHAISISHRLTAENSSSNTIGFRCLAGAQELKT